MELSDTQTLIEFISIDQALIQRQPPECQRLLQITLAFAQQLLDHARQLQATNRTLTETIGNLQKELQELKEARKTP